MRIKELGEWAGVSVKAVRYYESRGLLSPARRLRIGEIALPHSDRAHSG